MNLSACRAAEEKAQIANINIGLTILADFAREFVLIAQASFESDTFNFIGH